MTELLYLTTEIATSTPEYVSVYDQARMMGVLIGVLFMASAMILRWETKTGLPASFLFVYFVTGLALVGMAHRAILPPSLGGAFLMLLSFTIFAITGAVVLALSLSAGIQNDD